jgi:hypothetical protein
MSSSFQPSRSTGASQKSSKQGKNAGSKQIKMVPPAKTDFFQKTRKNKDEINIPADGNCLYTTIFLGYLLPVLKVEEEFSTRLNNLVGEISIEKTDGLRKFLLDNNNIEDAAQLRALSNPESQSLEERFKRHMDLQNKDWGGDEEIQILVNKLHIQIQEIVEVDSVAVQGVQPILPKGYQESENNQLITIYLCRCNPNAEESVDHAEDPVSQVVQYESSFSAQSNQHFRLRLINNPAHEEKEAGSDALSANHFSRGALFPEELKRDDSDDDFKEPEDDTQHKKKGFVPIFSFPKGSLIDAVSQSAPPKISFSPEEEVEISNCKKI